MIRCVLRSPLRSAIRSAIYSEGGGGVTPSFSADFSTAGTLTGFSSTVDLTMMQDAANGVYKYAPHNVFAGSEDIRSGQNGWGKDSQCVVTSGQLDPLGGSTASLISDNGAGDNPTADLRVYKNGLQLFANTDHRIGVFVKEATDGQGYARLQTFSFSSGDESTYFNLLNSTVDSLGHDAAYITDCGDGWHLLEIEFDPGDDDLGFWGVEPAKPGQAAPGNLNGEDWLYIWGAHCVRLPVPLIPAAERRMSQSAYYVKSGTAAAFAPRTGAYTPSGEGPGLHVEATARTNLLTYSNDQTNAAWTKTNLTVARDATGTEGTTSACTLTDADGSNVGTCTQSGTITNSSNPVTHRTWLRGGTSSTVHVKLALSGGTGVSKEGDVNLSTGAVTNESGTGTITVTSRNIGGTTRYEVIVEVDNNSTGNTTATVTAYGTDNTASSTGTAIGDNYELYDNADTAQIKGSSPVITAGSVVTQSQDLIYRAAADFPDATHSLIFSHATTSIPDNADDIASIGNSDFLQWFIDKYRLLHGGASIQGPAVTWAADQFFVSGYAYSGDGAALTTDGQTPVEDATTTGVIIDADVYLGRAFGGVNHEAPQFFGRWDEYDGTALSNAELQDLTS